MTRSGIQGWVMRKDAHAKADRIQEIPLSSPLASWRKVHVLRSEGEV
jgi:hypothetical protein